MPDNLEKHLAANIRQCQTEKIAVNKIKEKKPDGRRYWDRKDFCIYCDMLVTNFKRHLIRKHSEEIDVAKYLATDKSRKKLLLAEIKRKGNFFHNKNVLRNRQGELLVARRPVQSVLSTDYLPCNLCLGFFKRHVLYRHAKHCRKSKGEQSNKSLQSAGSTLLAPFDGLFSELKETIFPIMRHDFISNLVKCDSLICEFGSRLVNKNTEKHLRQVISGKLRELGRLLACLREKSNSENNLQEFIKPEYYNLVVECVKDVAGFDKKTGFFKTPSVATKLGHSLRQCADIVECKGIVNSQTNVKAAAEQFKIICEKQWQYDISARAMKSLHTSKFNKTNLIPLANDIQLINKLIAKQESEYKKLLHSKPNETYHRLLAEVTLAHVILLNRRRAGEVQRITIDLYKHLHQGIEDSEVPLNEVEKMLSKSLYRLEIPGKRGRKVAVLLTPVIKENIDLLLKTRYMCNIPEENPYIFATPNTTESCLRGCDALRHLAYACSAKAPEALKSTKLRKHIATVSQILNLNKNELEQLADFMGHNLNVHFEFYRLPDRTAQIAKLGKLLLALEQGQIGKYQGKRLDDINVDINNDDIYNSTESDEDVYKNDNLISNQVPQSMAQEEIAIRQQSTEVSSTTISTQETTVIQPKMRIFKKRKAALRKAWTQQEKEAVMKHLSKNVLLTKIPSKLECDNCKSNEPILQNRSWRNIKDYVYNIIKKQ